MEHQKKMMKMTMYDNGRGGMETRPWTVMLTTHRRDTHEVHILTCIHTANYLAFSFPALKSRYLLGVK